MFVQFSGGISSGAAHPIALIHAHRHRPVERRVWPIRHLRHMPMLVGIETQVVDVSRKIGFVMDQMLPIAPLQDAPFSAARRTTERRSVTGSLFENPPLISRQRRAKSESPGGSSITQGMCSGNATQP